jgi:hypothetical protein
MSLRKKVLLPTIGLVVLVMGISTGLLYFLSTNAFKQRLCPCEMQRLWPQMLPSFFLQVSLLSTGNLQFSLLHESIDL